MYCQCFGFKMDNIVSKMNVNGPLERSKIVNALEFISLKINSKAQMFSVFFFPYEL